MVESLENHRVRFVSWYRGLDIPDGEGNHLAPINLYLRSHYHVVETFANGDKIWERDDVTGPSPSFDDFRSDPRSDGFERRKCTGNDAESLGYSQLYFVDAVCVTVFFPLR